MLQKAEFDICELSLSSYLIAKSRGMPFTAIAVFPRRLFSLSQMWVNANAGIHSPQDLIGKKVGLSTFQTTLSVLAKGDLQTEYGIPWRSLDWYISKDEAIPLKPMENDWGYLRGNQLSHRPWEAYDAIVEECAAAWCFLIGDQNRIRSITHRDPAWVNV